MLVGEGLTWQEGTHFRGRKGGRLEKWEILGWRNIGEGIAAAPEGTQSEEVCL